MVGRPPLGLKAAESMLMLMPPMSNELSGSFSAGVGGRGSKEPEGDLEEDREEDDWVERELGSAAEDGETGEVLSGSMSMLKKSSTWKADDEEAGSLFMKAE